MLNTSIMGHKNVKGHTRMTFTHNKLSILKRSAKKILKDKNIKNKKHKDMYIEDHTGRLLDTFNFKAYSYDFQCLVIIT